MISPLPPVGSSGKLNVWPYGLPNDETVSYDDLLQVQDLTSSPLSDIYDGLEKLRNGYELGLVQISGPYKTPEAMIVKRLLSKVESGVYTREGVRDFFGKVGGVKGFVDGVISAVRASKDGKFKL